MTLDMVPLILDTGASVTITPFCSDFVTPLHSVQHITIKGIASGLKAEGVGGVSYTFVNDSGNEQTLTLQNCLYVPQCVVRLICPRQIGPRVFWMMDFMHLTSNQYSSLMDSIPR
jgi:hypothetical protein